MRFGCPSADDGGLFVALGLRLRVSGVGGDLADRANMSTRNLGRHFIATAGTTPLRWLHNQHVHLVQELLETTDASIDTIAARTGMGTAATLRRHFNRSVGVARTPTGEPSRAATHRRPVA